MYFVREEKGPNFLCMLLTQSMRQFLVLVFLVLHQHLTQLIITSPWDIFLFPLVLWNTLLFILLSLFLFLNSPSTVFCQAPLLHTSQFWSNLQLSTWAFLLCTFTTTVISFTIMSLNTISDDDYQTYNSWLDLSSHLLSCLSHILISWHMPN